LSLGGIMPDFLEDAVRDNDGMEFLKDFYMVRQERSRIEQWLENKIDRWHNAQRPIGKNRLSGMFNAFEAFCQKSLCYKNETISLCQSRTGQPLLRVPLFVSFFIKPDTKQNQTYAKYTKDDAKEQGQIFEEIAGKSNSSNVFAQIAQYFSDKFINHVFTDSHKNNLLNNVENDEIRGDYDQSAGGNRGNNNKYNSFTAQMSSLILKKIILSTAFFCLWAADGIAAEEIKFTATLDKMEYKTGEPILITFTLKNESKATVYVNKRFAIGPESVPKQKRDVCLLVTSPSGEKLTSPNNYEAGLPKSDDFVLLEPGKEVKSENPRNLEGFFEFNEPGTCKIVAVYQNFFGPEIGLEVFREKLTSQPVSLTIIKSNST